MPGSWGQQLLTGASAGFFGNPYVRDYTHAAKTFLPNSYQNAPKLKFLFHTVFEINNSVLDIGSTNLSVLVKSVKLPGFNIETQQMNQYNRKRINQTKIKYDPVTITFHDDCGDEISSLWYRYYTYYFQDGQNPQVEFNGKRGAAPNTQNAGGGTKAAANQVIYNQRTQYVPSTTGPFTGWGYTGQGVPLTGNPNTKTPFFNNITVFGINRHNWISYTLINPVITAFQHDTYDYEQGNGIMANTMTIDYETVVYNRGNLEGGAKSDNILKGFGDQAVYDKTVSPIQIPGANQKILGQGGLIDGVGGAIKDFTGTPAGILGAVKAAGTAYNTFKNAPVGSILKTEVTNVIQGQITKGLKNVLGGTQNATRNTKWEIPVWGQSGSVAGTAGTPPAAASESTPIVASAAPETIAAAQTAPSGVPPDQAFYKPMGNGPAGTQNPNPSSGNYTTTPISATGTDVQGFGSSY